MRVVGIDLGTRRIGVAVSAGSMAMPYETIHRHGDRRADHRAIAAVVAEVDADRVVVGLPLSLDGSKGPAARAAEAEVAELGAVLSVPVETYDERLTTVTAERDLRDRGMRAERRRSVVDQVAASVLLQAWLDRHGGTSSPADDPRSDVP
ncbi:MAG TPA: Holliday junction resolvase RuvX [Acidimicrobiales bacterium]|nr:Holliday junction resolvase RuvX [Acidimicrobiales bacterium]